MSLRRFRVYVPDNTGGFTPDQVYLCSEVDALLKEARELLNAAAPHWVNTEDRANWWHQQKAWLAATEPKP